MFRVVIFGSRHYNDQAAFDAALDHRLSSKHPDIEIVEGDCQGPDKMAGIYAAKRGYQRKTFPADWATHGKKAGFLRNRRMCDYVAKAEEKGAICFWDGVSAGTKMMLGFVRDASIPVKVISIPPPIDFSVKSPIKTRKKAIVIEGEELTPDEKQKPKKPARTNQTEYRHDYKKLYLEAHEAWFKQQFPHAHKDGHYQPKKIPDVNTANGIASYVIDHCAWTGQYANRINVQGRQIGGFTKTQSGKVFDDRKFIKASTKKGTPDLDLIINGTAIKPEIKINSDTESKDQIKQAAKITKAGGVSVVFRSIDDYFDIYFRYTVKQPNLFGEE